MGFGRRSRNLLTTKAQRTRRKGLRKFVFWRECFEAEETFCESIPLLNKNSLWIWFVDSISAFSLNLRWLRTAKDKSNLPLSAARSDSTPRHKGHEEKVWESLFFGADGSWSNVHIATFES
jgi:hypothetical protein